jgi:cytoskeletal protein CcmA (bactofilin family)
MKRKFHFLVLTIVLALVFLPARAVFAQGACPDEGGLIYGRNCTLESGETFDGDLVVFGGNVTLKEGAELNGNLVVFGGTLKSDGELNGDIAIFGGQVSLDEHALVTGDVILVGSQLERAEGAVVEGDVVNNIQPEVDLPNARLPDHSVSSSSGVNIDFGFSLFAQVFQVIFAAVIAAGFAMLLSLFWKPQMERAGNAIVSQPLIVGAVGLLSFAVAALLLLTIVPPLVLGFAWLFGVVALGSEIGERFAKAINQSWSPALTVGFGSFLLVLVGGALGFIPCIGGLVQFFLSLLAVGAVVVTRFGARPIQSSGMIVNAPPPPAA